MASLFNKVKTGANDLIGGVKSGFKDTKDVLFGTGQGFEPPERQIVDLNQSTKNLMADREKLANRSEEELVADAMTNSQQDVGRFQNDIASLSTGLAGSNPMGEAIKARQGKRYLQDFNKLKREAEYQAPLEKQKLMSSVAQDRLAKANAAAGVANMNRQSELIKWQAEENKKAQRRQVIGSVLGIVGTGVGALAGNPAAGAMAGSSAGGLVGGQSQGNVSDLK